MNHKRILLVLFAPALLLLIPLGAMRFSSEMAWTGRDFLTAWIFLAGGGLAYELVLRSARGLSYRLGAGLGLAATFLIVAVSGTVGFIGSEDHPANIVYAGVVAVALIGSIITRLAPAGMARAMAVSAIAQGVAPLIALALWRLELNAAMAKVIAFNSILALLFVGSAWFFRQAAGGSTVAPEQAAA
jgi:hypothetical protein